MTAIDSSSASLSAPPTSCPPCPSLLRLPAVLLSQLCSFMSPLEVLTTLARTANSSRHLLTADCFSAHVLTLGPDQLWQLSLVEPPSAVTLRAFLSRLFTHCRLCVLLESDYDRTRCSVQQALDALAHFPACNTFCLVSDDDCADYEAIDNDELHSLLHHHATINCSELEVGTLCRSDAHRTPVEAFDWTALRLPALTCLTLHILNSPLDTGTAAFLTAHTALLQLEVNVEFVSVTALTALFQDPTALPLLSHFSLGQDEYEEEPTGYNLVPVLTALATTVVGSGGTRRPVVRLRLHVHASNGVFSAAALLSQLTHLDVSRAGLGWLQKWSEAPNILSAFPQLQTCTIDTCGRWDHHSRKTAPKDMLPFFQSMPVTLQSLSITTGEHASFAAVMAEFVRLEQLHEFFFSAGSPSTSASNYMTDRNIFSSFTTGCLSCLRSLTLQHVKLSAESIVAIVSAAPNLCTLCLDPVGLTCHPAIACAIIGGYCEHIEKVTVEDSSSHYRAWRNVRVSEVVGAYQAAVTSAGRSEGYKPFTQLRYLWLKKCWCTPPSVWHATLSLLRYAINLRCVAKLGSSDPLIIAALSYLPSIRAFETGCVWPPSLATLMTRRDVETGQYSFVHNTTALVIEQHYDEHCREDELVCELTERADIGHRGTEARGRKTPVHLLPRSDLLTAYQRSLSDEHQTVLERWAAGDFRAGDEKIHARETPLHTGAANNPIADGFEQHCSDDFLFYNRYKVGVSHEGSEEQMTDVGQSTE